MIWTEREPLYLPMGSEATRDYQRRWVIAMLERRAECALREARALRTCLLAARATVAAVTSEAEAEARRANSYADRNVTAENSKALAETALDGCKAELNEARRALAWVTRSLPFEADNLPTHLAPPDFVSRQVRIAKEAW